MRNHNRLPIAITIAGLTAVMLFVIFRNVQPVKAFNPQPDHPVFGMVGITTGQTIRINVVNTAEPNPNSPPDPCRVVLTFRDANGNFFLNNDGNPIRRIVLLNAGESAFLELNADNFGRDVAGRIELRPVARIQQADSINGTPPDPCIPTVEVINNANGRTQFLVPALPAIQRTTQTTN